MNDLFSKPPFDLIHRGVELRQLDIVVKQVQLWHAIDQFTQANTHQTDHQSAIVEPVKNAVDNLAQHMVEGGVRDALLHVVRVEVGIADLHRHTARQLMLRSQVETQALHHVRQAMADTRHIDSVLLKGMFLADRLPLLIGTHRRAVVPVGLLPDIDAVFT